MFLISLLELKIYMKAKELIIFTYTFAMPYCQPKKEKKRKSNNSIEITTDNRKISTFITKLHSIHSEREVPCNSSKKK